MNIKFTLLAVLLLVFQACGSGAQQQTPQWTTVPFDAADYSASHGNWIVSQQNVDTNVYIVDSSTKTMVWSFRIAGTSVSGQPTNNLRIKIPAGKFPAYSMSNAVNVYDNGVGTAGVVDVCVPIVGIWDGTMLSIYRSDGQNFSTSNGQTHVAGQITFSIQ